MRLRTLLAATALGLGTLTVTTATTGPPAAGAAPQCQGRRATIIGSSDTVTGTRRDDVIITNGASLVEARGGDDRICVTGAGATVKAGAGSDRVVNKTGATVTATLGRGTNSYAGGPGADVVRTGVPGVRDTDRISLGAGDDTVTAVLKAGDDLAVSGGDGTDQLVPTARGTVAGVWIVDNVAQRATLDGSVPARWSGLESFSLADAGGTSQSFLGSAVAEGVVLAADRVVADLGAGDDTLQVAPSFAPSGTLSGGAGRDQLVSYASTYAAGNLATGRLAFDPRSAGYALSLFEGLTVSARQVKLTGDSGPDRLRAWGCRVVLAGGKGKDLLWTEPRPGLGWACSSPTRYVLRGQGGNDRLVGWTGFDVLKGGAGTDFARGNGSKDRCQAERRRSCERR